MANENKEESFYQMDFYLDSDCNTDFSELNSVTLHCKKIDKFVEKLKLIRNFRKNIHNICIHKFENGRCNTLMFTSTIKEVEEWFKGRGIKL